MSTLVLIDNGHGQNTPGKCSPDRSLMEWAWTRGIAARVVARLKEQGQNARLLVPEDTDISLTERCARVNRECAKMGSGNVVMVSIHVNAAGSDGKWHDARGFSVWVASKCSAHSEQLAHLLLEGAERRNLMGNRWVPKERLWRADFAMVKRTNCPAVLTENLFQDNKEDVAWLLSDEGRKTIVDLHVEAIMKYLEP